MKRALDSVNEKILAAVQRGSNLTVTNQKLPRLVAVSKLKPIASIIEAYECGQRYFGENYIQELEDKSNSAEIIEKCPEIKFHFIGHLQSNKVNKLLKVRNLHMIETIDSIKLADLIDKAIGRQKSGSQQEASSGDEEAGTRFYGGEKRLKVMIQVNTSGEEQKNGIQPDEAPNLAEHIEKQCKFLELAGIMTIGKFDGWGDNVPNQDFLRMRELRDLISKRISVEPQLLELSMGMSSDFEEAICMGSTSVRVGTLIFGQRSPKR